MIDDAEIQKRVKAIGGLAYSAAITRMNLGWGAKIARYDSEEMVAAYVSYIFSEHGNGD